MEERVVLTAEMRDEASAPLGRVQQAVRRTTAVVTGANREQAASTTQSSSRIMTALGRVRTGATQTGAGFSRLTGVTRTAFTGVRNAITSASGGIERAARSVGDRAGGAMESGMGSKLKGLAGRLLAPLAVGAVVGMAVGGGIARQLNIEDAEAKLSGLGNSTEKVKAIMDNAMTSVSGTAFGMGDAATVAAGAVAAGIEPGKELTRVLSLTADAATIAGKDMGSMGSIFNKVAASGKLQGDVIAQLQDAGVPVLQFVAKEMGVTAAEAAKMASAGKVNFETFANAMEKGLGGAAQKSGNTTKGALANMKASFSRFGVVLTSWYLPLMKNVFNAVNKGMDAVTKALKPFMNAFGDAFQKKMGPAIDAFGEKLVKAVSWIATAISAVKSILIDGDFTGKFYEAFHLEEDSTAVAVLFRIRDGLVVASKWLRDTKTDVDNFFLGLTAGKDKVAEMADAANLAGGSLDGMVAKGQAVRDFFGNLSPAGMGAIAGVAVMLLGVFGKFTPILGPVMSLVGGLGPIVGQLAGAFRFLLGPVGLIIGLLAMAYATSEPFRDAINGLLGAVMNLGMTLLSALMPVFTTLMTSIMPIVLQLFDALVPVLIMVVEAITPIVVMLAEKFVPIIVQLIEALLPPVMLLIGLLADVFVTLLTALAPILEPLLGLVGIMLDLIVSILTPIIPLIVIVAELIGGVLGGAINLLLPIIKFLLEAFVNIVKFMEGPLTAIIGAIAGLFKGLGDIINGVVGSVKDFVSNPLGGIQDMLGMKKDNSGGGTYSGGGVAGFAGGGVLGGYAPGKDTIPAMLSKGESVLVPELTRAIGPQNIMAANHAASGGRPAGGGPAFSASIAQRLNGGNNSAGAGSVVIEKGAVQVTVAGGATTEVVQDMIAQLEAMLDELLDKALDKKVTNAQKRAY